MGETIIKFKETDGRIDDGLRKIGRGKAASAYAYFKEHPFGDCFAASGEICLTCKKENHKYGECATISGEKDVCGPCKIKEHDFAACYKYMKTLCLACCKSQHPKHACAMYLSVSCQGCRMEAR